MNSTTKLGFRRPLARFSQADYQETVADAAKKREVLRASDLI